MSRLMTQPDLGSAPRTWAEQLVPYVPGASQDFIEQNLLWVLRDFCDMGLAWVMPTARIQLTPDFPDYVISTPVAETAICAVLGLKTDDGRMLWPVDRQSSFIHGDKDLGAYYCPIPSTIHLIQPFAEEGRWLQALVALVPLTFYVPSWFRHQYQAAIETGVIGRMNMLPNRPWTDKADGTLRWRQYLNMRNMARIKSLRAHTSAGQGWRFPRFGV